MVTKQFFSFEKLNFFVKSSRNLKIPQHLTLSKLPRRLPCAIHALFSALRRHLVAKCERNPKKSARKCKENFPLTWPPARRPRVTSGTQSRATAVCSHIVFAVENSLAEGNLHVKVNKNQKYSKRKFLSRQKFLKTFLNIRKLPPKIPVP